MFNGRKPERSSGGKPPKNFTTPPPEQDAPAAGRFALFLPKNSSCLPGELCYRSALFRAAAHEASAGRT
jgi:hypothetical protein